MEVPALPQPGLWEERVLLAVVVAAAVEGQIQAVLVGLAAAASVESGLPYEIRSDRL